jgi:PAS domain S-box-containing protein
MFFKKKSKKSNQAISKTVNISRKKIKEDNLDKFIEEYQNNNFRSFLFNPLFRIKITHVVGVSILLGSAFFTEELIPQIIQIVVAVVVAIHDFDDKFLKTNLSKKISLLKDKDAYIGQIVITSETDIDGIITDVSDAFCNISGYEKDELVGKLHSIGETEGNSSELFVDMWDKLNRNETWQGELKNQKKNGDIYWLDLTISPRFNASGDKVGYKAVGFNITDKKAVEDLSKNLELKVEERTKQLLESKSEIEKSHKNIRDSIAFAALIQQAILPQDKLLERYTEEYFTFWQPKDTVGGDIFFVSELSSNNEILVMVIDGAGHGVPGAFVTMLVKAVETQISADISNQRLEPDPALILSYFNKSIKTMLKQEKGSKSNAGFDGGILYYNKETNVCKYAGAKTPLYIVNDDLEELEIITSDRKNVGFVRTDFDQTYTSYDIQIREGTKLYFCTDGIVDQEGLEEKRFGKSQLESFLIEMKGVSLEKQKDILISRFEEFKNNLPQSDDATIVALKFL